MGDNINIGEALIITGFSMVVVFIGLTVISILIGLLKKLGEEKEEESMETWEIPIKKDEPVKEDQEVIIDDEELVAVIAAAIAASMGVSIPELNIKSIKRVAQTTPAWAVASRQEQISGKL